MYHALHAHSSPSYVCTTISYERFTVKYSHSLSYPLVEKDLRNKCQHGYVYSWRWDIELMPDGNELRLHQSFKKYSQSAISQDWSKMRGSGLDTVNIKHSLNDPIS